MVARTTANVNIKRVSCINATSHTSIPSGKRILKDQARSFQIEGHFGAIKENHGVRHPNYRSEEKSVFEIHSVMNKRNINKYHHFLHHAIQKRLKRKQRKKQSRNQHMEKSA